MSRQEQNLLLGALAFITAVVMGMVAIRVLTGDSGNGGEVAAGDATAGSQTDAADASVTLPPADGTDSSLGLDSTPTTGAAAPSLSSSSLTVSTTPLPPPTLPPTTEGLNPPTTAPTTAPPTTAPSSTGPSTTAPVDPSTSASAGGSSSSAPDGSSTVPSSSVPASSTSSVPGSTTSTTDGGSTSNTMNSLELEIFRLTNQLRTDPNGALARQGAVPDCGGSLRVDRATGVYEAIGALTLNEVASLQVARPWSNQLTRNLSHQPQAGADALVAAGLNVAFVGENVSFNNYPDKAMQHFIGWRESDGHFCNMMNPRFTHIGVGEVTKADGDSFATQNLFSLR